MLETQCHFLHVQVFLEIEDKSDIITFTIYALVSFHFINMQLNIKLIITMLRGCVMNFGVITMVSMLLSSSP